MVLTTLTLSFFFFNDTATTEIYSLSLHDALPILQDQLLRLRLVQSVERLASLLEAAAKRELSYSDFQQRDRKSTRLNSSHQIISYAVFCLKKKKAKK